MIEKIESLEALQKKYKIIPLTRRPAYGDLVYAPILKGVFEVKHVEGFTVRVYANNGVVTLPSRSYKLVEKIKKKPSKKK